MQVGYEVTLAAQLEGPLTEINEVTLSLRYYLSSTNEVTTLTSQWFGNATSPVQLPGTFPAQAVPGGVKFDATATVTTVHQGSPSSFQVTTVDSPVVEVNFVPPITTLSAPTSNPKVGDTTSITATVVAAIGSGGANEPIVGVDVAFEITGSPIPAGSRTPEAFVSKTGEHRCT